MNRTFEKEQIMTSKIKKYAFTWILILCISMFLSFPLSVYCDAEIIAPDIKIISDSPETNARFGHEVSIEGDIAVIGEPLKDIDAILNAGIVHVYTRSNGDWIKSATLMNPSPVSNDQFGRDVAICGDVICVGVPYKKDTVDGKGVVYVYTKPPSGWSGTLLSNATLKSTFPGNDDFGRSVSMSGDTVVVGAYGENSDSGGAYIFQKPIGEWSGTLTENASLSASGLQSEAEFGWSVDISGDTVVIGSPQDQDSGNGKSYIFEKPDGGWSGALFPDAILTASDGATSDQFGYDVAIDNNTVIVSAARDTSTYNNTTYLFEKPTSGWADMTETAQLKNDPSSADGGKFGYSIAIDDNAILIGSPTYASKGMAYVFIKPDFGWSAQNLYYPNLALKPGDLSNSDLFGVVSLSGGIALVSSRLDNFDGITDAGSVYAFTIPKLWIEPDGITVNPDQNIELTIRLTNNISSIVGYRIALDLDTDKLTYVPGSATKVGTSTETGWDSIVVNNTNPALAIFVCASASGSISTSSASLMKFLVHVDDSVSALDNIAITFNSLTSLNEDAIAFKGETWNANVQGANQPPTFDGGDNQVVLEDAPQISEEHWATNIAAGPLYESGQSVYFTVDNSNPGLFSESPWIDPISGTLYYTSSVNAFGICDATAILHDDGGTAFGGIDQSTPYVFTIEVLSVNDQPSFIVGATPVVLNATGGQATLLNWATGINVGPSNESGQVPSFIVQTDQAEKFSATPTIDAAGALQFTPNVGAHGVINATVVMIDGGGTANGGVDASTPQHYITKIYIPFLWGDLNDNAQAGSVDASLLLKFDAELVDSFPGYPVEDYPEYYPDPIQPWLNFPTAADVNNDDIAGTLDASLIMQQYALLIDDLPADTDQDQWGPDEPLPAGKVSTRSVARTMSVSVDAVGDSYYVNFKIDNADQLSGLRLVLIYDPSQVSVDEPETQWLVPNGMIVTNNLEPGRFIIAGALMSPLEEGASDLIQVKFNLTENAIGSILISIDEEMTQINDGQIQLTYDSIHVIDVSSPTDVGGWMLH
jgi:FG-GAP repeat protein